MTLCTEVDVGTEDDIYEYLLHIDCFFNLVEGFLVIGLLLVLTKSNCFNDSRVIIFIF